LPSPVPESRPDAARGVGAAAGCYVIWGLVPLYWRPLAAVDALELIAHRIVWTLVLLAIVLVWIRGGRGIRPALSSPRGFAVHLLSSILLSANWLIYVWAVNSGHVIESSLGYFLVPLINIALGRLVLGESLRPLQWAAVTCAAAGVGLLVIRLGHVPWIALGLAGSFGVYGLLRKRSPLGPLDGLAVETGLLAPFAAGLLLLEAIRGTGALGVVGPATTALVLSTGAVTAVPLLLFAYAARRLRLTTLGLLQYLGPTLQFLLGWLYFGEPFSPERATAFAVIWTGLALYTADAVARQRRASQTDDEPARGGG
jgi:chloramphenicol-sensitive protein RarD